MHKLPFALMRIRLAAFSWALLSMTAADAQTAQSLNVRALSATCANCHGTDGRAEPGSATARLAGLSREYIVSQMQAFRDGTRPATVMHQLAKGYSDAQIESIAAYFANQK